MTFTAQGTSPKVTITAEKFNSHYYSSVVDVDLPIKPPDINAGFASSYAMTKWKNPWELIAFGKIVEPHYDGIGDKIGTISNLPDFIKDTHIISLMRLVDKYLETAYISNINVSASSPSPNKPPAPANNRGW